MVAEEHVDLSHAVVKTSFAVLCDKSGRRDVLGQEITHRGTDNRAELRFMSGCFSSPKGG